MVVVQGVINKKY